MKLCGTCRYFTDKQGPGKTGTCRCYPPQLVWMNNGTQINAKYPEVKPDMRACGRHERDKRVINLENSCHGYAETDERQWKGRGGNGS